MNCGHSREQLALFIEDDLAGFQAEKISRQIGACAECRLFCEQLRTTQSLIKERLKSPFQTPPNPELFAAVRAGVLSQIQEQRFFFRPPRYAFAGFVVLMIVSVVLLGQVRRTPAAQFAGKAALLRPQGYREWVSAGENIYVDPAAWREYSKTGRFPEGTVLVRERVRPRTAQETAQEREPHGSLVVSVKDGNRFEGGWGFFDFSDSGKTQAISDASCRRCHSAGMAIG
ncbi:MAG TPA: cytochrome P460 family protein [Terriglobia bacterium]|jgi:hypothetical protein